jgi:ABC-type arginine/histidine transport system permease subunit
LCLAKVFEIKYRLTTLSLLYNAIIVCKVLTLSLVCASMANPQYLFYNAPIEEYLVHGTPFKKWS